MEMLEQMVKSTYVGPIEDPTGILGHTKCIFRPTSIHIGVYIVKMRSVQCTLHIGVVISFFGFSFFGLDLLFVL